VPAAKKTDNTPQVILIPIGLIASIIFSLFMKLSNPSENKISQRDITDYQRGSYNYVQGDYPTALRHFNSAINSDPEFGEAYNSRGLVYFDQGNYDSAITNFNRAIELFPNSATSYSNRGIAYYAIGDDNHALADLETAIQLDPDFAKAYYNRGLIYLARGSLDSAIADFDRAIQYTSENWFDFSTRENETEQSKILSEPLIEYSRLSQTYADLPTAYYYRGVAYLAKGDYDQAKIDFEKAIELGLDPDLQQKIEYYLQE